MWDTIILNPMTNLLLFLYQILFNNFALSVVIFTLITRLITLPFTLKQQRSTRATQAIQPELQALQKKYANDREKLAQAQMELYKKHGVNPMSGCLPLLLTMPIMFGLYQAIIAALASTPLQLIELSQRLYSWAPTLAQLIPLNNKWLGINLGLPPGGTQPWYAYALILLVVATGYWQQKVISPQTAPAADQGDNPMAGMSQSMMYSMPLMFGFFALSFASGLSIYFVISNLIGVLQYWGLGKMGLMGPAAAAPASGSKSSGELAKAQADSPAPAAKPKKKRAKR
jgi:YidC/Oxa1 family membrane protein insertase